MTQPTDPKYFLQKSSKPAKKEKPDGQGKPEKSGSDVLLLPPVEVPVEAKADEQPKKEPDAAVNKDGEKKEDAADKAAQDANKKDENDAAQALEGVAAPLGEPENADREAAKQESA